MVILKRAIGGVLLSFVFLAVFVYLISGIRWALDNPTGLQGEKALLGDISGNVTGITQKNPDDTSVKPTDLLELSAKAAISVDTNLQGENKVVFEKDSNMPLPIASLTKLMTAVIVLDNYNLTDTVVVDRLSDAQDPMKKDVKLGDIMPVESFLQIMLIGSSNKSAYALAELIGEQKFVSMMNQKAEGLGMKNTSFADPTGLSAQNVSTASDLVKLAVYIIGNYPKITEVSKLKEIDIPRFGRLTNTDQLLGEIPDVVCSKTGFTDPAGGCLLLVVNNPKGNGYLVNVILGAGDRFSEMKKLINWASINCN